MPRDFELLKVINDCTILNRDQIAKVFWNDKKTSYGRLRLLFDHEYIDNKLAIDDEGEIATFYSVTPKAAGLLSAKFHYLPEDINRARPTHYRDNVLPHLSFLNDFRTDLIGACRNTKKIDLDVWVNEDRFRNQYTQWFMNVTDAKGRTKSLFPDFFFTLNQPAGASAYFVEADRSTEDVAQVQGQMQVYLNYFQHRLHLEHSPTGQATRVLIFVHNERRLKWFKDKIEQLTSEGLRFAITTRDDLSPETFFAEPIWETPNVSGKHLLFSDS